jgi:acyl transferase domain-containing protein
MTLLPPTAPPLPVVFCFAGQGSQYYGMAADLMATNAVFRHWMQLGDAIVAQRHGFSVLAEIYDDDRPPGAAFERMEASHPAIFLVQFALTKVLQHHRLRPDMLLGVSLGEFTAQAVAGMMPFEASLCAVADQPALFRRTCPAGGMMAVLGSPDLHAQRPLLTARAEVAGVNSDGHFILSALADDLPAIEEELRLCDVPFLRLPVPFAFHSRFVDAAKDAWCEAFAQQRRETPFWPVWSSCTSDTIGPATPDLAWRVVREGMNLRQTLRTLEQRGGAIYVDLSPSGTLAALFRQALDKTSPSRLLSVLSPFGGNIDRLGKTVDSLRG